MDRRRPRLCRVLGGGGAGQFQGNLGSQKEPRGLGSNLRQSGTGRHQAPSFGLTGAGAGTQRPRRSGIAGSGVGGPGRGLSALRPRPSPGRHLRIGCSSLTSEDPAPARALPRAHPRAAAAAYASPAPARCRRSRLLSPGCAGLDVGHLDRGGGQAMLQRPEQPWRPRQAAWRS